ncbi:hypothetical protein [Pendulispora albinea]|uniref:Lipoprotein n=1 Tax=Pendulispora albinea TaxID=2741071 RepID=A0ABZ2LTD6_9BACT
MIRRSILRMFVGVALAAGATGAVCGAVGCKTLEHGAAKDPQKCERDPGCTSKQEKSKDCATACADNIECMERCQQVNGRR